MLDDNNNSHNNSNICTLNTHNLSPPLSLSLTTTTTTDDFFVDQLLNFNPNDEQQEQDEDEDGCLVVDGGAGGGLSPVVDQFSPGFGFGFDIDHDQRGFDFDLDQHVEDEADLEWLSRFVEDSFSQFSSPFPHGVVPIKPEPRPGSPRRASSSRFSSQRPDGTGAEPKPEPGSPRVAPFASPPTLNRSRRSKRVSTGNQLGSTSLEEPSPSTPSPARKKARTEVGPGSGRRCSHCGVQKTPQWRLGPMGPKSLCNACGVRYKTGRLFPEYRPACSPTFSSDVHSNSHKKVLEMRMKKVGRVSGRVEPDPGPGFGLQR